MPDGLAEQVERLAHHALRGEVWDKAVIYCQQAGAKVYDRAAFRESVACFDQALQALAHLPEDGDSRVLAIEIRLALEGPLRALAEHGRNLALLGEAEALARALDDRARLGRVLAGMARLLRTTGDSDGAMAAGQQALALAVELGDSALQVQASYRLGQAYYAIGDFGRAVELLWRNVEAADRESGTPSTDLLIESRAWLARTLSALGAFAEGRRHGEEALRLATMEGRGDTPIIAHAWLGDLYFVKGDLEQAIRVLEPGLALCHASGNRTMLRWIAAALGSAYALQGRLAEGCALLEEAISESIRYGRAARSCLSGRMAQRGLPSDGTRRGGPATRAPSARPRSAAQRACRRGARAAPAWRCPCLLRLPQMARRPKCTTSRPWPWPRNSACARSQAHCHLGLGTLYTKMGRREQARAELSTAIELYRAMEMTFWLPQAEAALAQVV